MPTLGLETHIVDPVIHRRSVQHFREARILLPTFAELAEPRRIPIDLRQRLAAVDPDAAHPLNLFRIHWFNRAAHAGPEPGGLRPVPDHILLPSRLTGVAAKIVLLPADRFPMIGAHKVLATYGCLVPRVICGQFDPGRHRAIWPSTGNYCRGGVAVSKILRCRSAAMLPRGMSRERFEWLSRWVEDPADIIGTPGSESNVKEIYDRCAELEAEDPANIVFNQFREFGNYVAHYACTGPAVARVAEHLQQAAPGLALRAFAAATGSAGTLAAGDYLKEHFGSLTVAVEALECPTLLYNGFGEHNIQGIGDKHIPLIHNVMATDLATAVSDRATDELFLLFNTAAGRAYLARRCGLGLEEIASLGRLGLSSICNLVAAIKVARYLDLGEEDLVATVATDGASLYGSEQEKIAARSFPEEAFPDGFDALAAAETYGRHLRGASTDHLVELARRDRERIFNLGYYTWVEQRGVTLEEFTARRDPAFWRRLLGLAPAWDEMIEEFNRETGVRELL